MTNIIRKEPRRVAEDGTVLSTYPVVRCENCSSEVHCRDGWANSCECGQGFNGSGQSLAHRSQRGEEAGETLTSILLAAVFFIAILLIVGKSINSPVGDFSVAVKHGKELVSFLLFPTIIMSAICFIVGSRLYIKLNDQIDPEDKTNLQSRINRYYTFSAIFIMCAVMCFVVS